MTETAWLIEKLGTRRRTTNPPTWWTGLGFSADSLEAVRFSRALDAERAVLGLADQTRLVVTEHQWSRPVPVPRRLRTPETYR